MRTTVIDISQANTNLLTAVRNGSVNDLNEALKSIAEIWYVDWGVLQLAINKDSPEILKTCLEHLRKLKEENNLPDKEQTLP